MLKGWMTHDHTDTSDKVELWQLVEITPFTRCDIVSAFSFLTTVTLLISLYVLRISVCCLLRSLRRIVACRKSVLRAKCVGEQHWTEETLNFLKLIRVLRWSQLWGCLELKCPFGGVSDWGKGATSLLRDAGCSRVRALSLDRAAPFS